MSELGLTLTGLFPSQLTGTPGKGGLPVQVSLWSSATGPLCLAAVQNASGCFPASSNTQTQECFILFYTFCHDILTLCASCIYSEPAFLLLQQTKLFMNLDRVSSHGT